MRVKQRETNYLPDSTAEDENFVVGQDDTVVGDEEDNMKVFINLLFDDPQFNLTSIRFFEQTVQIRRKS